MIAFSFFIFFSILYFFILHDNFKRTNDHFVFCNGLLVFITIVVILFFFVMYLSLMVIHFLFIFNFKIKIFNSIQFNVKLIWTVTHVDSGDDVFSNLFILSIPPEESVQVHLILQAKWSYTSFWCRREPQTFLSWTQIRLRKWDIGHQALLAGDHIFIHTSSLEFLAAVPHNAYRCCQRVGVWCHQVDHISYWSSPMVNTLFGKFLGWSSCHRFMNLACVNSMPLRIFVELFLCPQIDLR